MERVAATEKTTLPLYISLTTRWVTGEAKKFLALVDIAICITPKKLDPVSDQMCFGYAYLDGTFSPGYVIVVRIQDLLHFI